MRQLILYYVTEFGTHLWTALCGQKMQSGGERWGFQFT